jgi:hypothetical protein
MAVGALNDRPSKLPCVSGGAGKGVGEDVLGEDVVGQRAT